MKPIIEHKEKKMVKKMVLPPKEEVRINTGNEPNPFWKEKIVGQKMVFQLQGGVMVQGEAIESDSVFLEIRNCVVVGSHYKVQVKTTWINKKAIRHMTLIPTKVEKIGDES